MIEGRANLDSDDRQPNSTHKWIAIFSGIGIVVFWLLTFLLLFLYPDSPEKRGTFGDMFGAINALFSGFALLGIIIAIMMQRDELALQRKELQLTRDEAKQAREAHQESAKSLQRQSRNMEETYRVQLIATLAEALNTLGTIYQRYINEAESAG